MNPYRRRIFKLIQPLLEEISPVGHVLDFGTGDGWFARQFEESLPRAQITAVDVMQRKNSFVAPIIYDGVRLPFESCSFDLVYAVDVLHHCPDPPTAIREMLRCTGRFCLTKDHTYRNSIQYAGLCLLDEIGNRRFGIPCRYKYQNEEEWEDVFAQSGFRRQRILSPLPCHTGLMGVLVNRMEYIALYCRVDGSP